MIKKLSVLIIGNGHYTSGSTVVEGESETDKDFGVVLPAVFELHKQGLINKIFLAARQGSKFIKLKNKLKIMKNDFGWDVDIKLFPEDNRSDDFAYLKALNKVPKPAVAIIATPDHLHKKIILDVFKKDLHFLVVKPAVTSLNELDEVINAQAKFKKLGFVDYHKVYDDANLILKQNIEKNVYGKIQHIYTKMTQKRIMLDIFKNWIGKKKNNVNHYLGSHYIHLVGFITKAVPINVRAICQYGVAKKEYGIDTPDLIETQIIWQTKQKEQFTSYHIAGWGDPVETAGMTYQELHMITTSGHIESDQRFRGLEWTIENKGHTIINPYFFNLHKQLNGELDLGGEYGFKSIKNFIIAALEVENGGTIDKYEMNYPTIKESRHVTAILQAADESLEKASAIIKLK